MANEITVGAFIQVQNGNLSDRFAPGNKSVDQSAVGGPTPGYVTIGTTEEEVAFGELSTKGWVMMQNLDPTNYVQWGFSTGVYGGRMRAGETAGPFRMDATSIFLRANTAACKVLIKGYEA
jgi:hypothetical protein